MMSQNFGLEEFRKCRDFFRTLQLPSMGKENGRDPKNLSSNVKGAEDLPQPTFGIASRIHAIQVRQELGHDSSGALNKIDGRVWHGRSAYIATRSLVMCIEGSL
ncbi:hypothetical protein ACMFMG_009008 [Clarireedia jacksonii]